MVKLTNYSETMELVKAGTGIVNILDIAHGEEKFYFLEGNVWKSLDKVPMELVGLDGNAFFLMGTFQKKARKSGWPKPAIDAVIEECTSSDYDNLLATLMKYTTDEDGSTEEWE